MCRSKIQSATRRMLESEGRIRWVETHHCLYQHRGRIFSALLSTLLTSVAVNEQLHKIDVEVLLPSLQSVRKRCPRCCGRDAREQLRCSFAHSEGSLQSTEILRTLPINLGQKVTCAYDKRVPAPCLGQKVGSHLALDTIPGTLALGTITLTLALECADKFLSRRQGKCRASKGETTAGQKA
jgi:hypothetical protein